MGLTFEALIEYHNRTGDARVLPAVRTAADWMWATLWNVQAEAFPYILCRAPNSNPECQQNPFTGAADLNLLIAPVFGWLYHMTGDPVYIQRGDAVFAGGVRRAWLGNGKQFSQNYRWSFEYLRWRDGR
jgi:hypothetical protein